MLTVSCSSPRHSHLSQRQIVIGTGPVAHWTMLPHCGQRLEVSGIDLLLWASVGSLDASIPALTGKLEILLILLDAVGPALEDVSRLKHWPNSATGIEDPVAWLTGS